MRYYETLVRAIHDNAPVEKKREIEELHPKFFDPEKQKLIDDLTEQQWQRLKSEPSRVNE